MKTNLLCVLTGLKWFLKIIVNGMVDVAVSDGRFKFSNSLSEQGVVPTKRSSHTVDSSTFTWLHLIHLILFFLYRL